MPKRKQDSSAVAASPRLDKPPRSPKNQERAYIAASRRADRKLEDRVRSAHLASKVHKQRTGKAFRITDEVVLRQEMYEEEDDSLPRSYLLLGPHMQTASHEMNRKVDAFLTNKMAMSALIAQSAEEWRTNEINSLFAQSFPNATVQAQQLTEARKQTPVSTPSGESSALSPSTQTADYQPTASHHSESTKSASSRQGISSNMRAPSTHNSAQRSFVPAFSPMSQAGISTFSDMSGFADMAPPAAAFGQDSPFTTELPNDVKQFMMSNVDPTNPFLQKGFDSYQSSYDDQSFEQFSMIDGTCNDNIQKEKDVAKINFDMSYNQDSEHLSTGAHSVDPHLQVDPFQPLSQEEPTWDNFIDEDAWGSSEQL